MINIRKKFLHTDDTPLVPMTEAGKANGSNAASSTSGAKMRSRPNNEYVLYSYGEPVGMTNDSGTSYFGTDILGSVRSVTDKYGTVQSSYDYDAFGSPYLGNLDNGMSFGYTGKAYDIGTGLYDYGFRDYSPNNARFTTIDPIRDGSNWFSYVVNDPVNYVDPLGLSTSDRGSSPNFNSGMFGQNVGFDGFRLASQTTTAKTNNNASTTQTSTFKASGILQGGGIIFMVLGGITNEPLLSLTGLVFYLSGRNDEIGFSVRHPIIALQMGFPIDGGKYGLNSAATNFAINSGLSKSAFEGALDDQGSKKGAYRHTVWMAMTSAKYGDDIALELGNSHDPITPPKQSSYTSLTDADTYCDQMNNIVGRNLGTDSNLSNKELALKTLDIFHTSGLYTVAKNADGTYSVELTKISDIEYYNAYLVLSTKNNQGLSE